ncbi:hypothetical protein [Shouchella patagoniensis]|uniref:hypothetical protein n=1 Tax=Shouchella patagoniensis TaxID=228576 RepID=UPI000994FA4B|nr:hypothetical protein [Shouchella patagoniensis]
MKRRLKIIALLTLALFVFRHVQDYMYYLRGEYSTFEIQSLLFISAIIVAILGYPSKTLQMKRINPKNGIEKTGLIQLTARAVLCGHTAW